jgi:hypothetical protein
MALFFFIFDPAFTFNVHMSICSYIIFNIPTLRDGVNHENTLIATISGQMGLVERRRRFEPLWPTLAPPWHWALLESNK